MESSTEIDEGISRDLALVARINHLERRLKSHERWTTFIVAVLCLALIVLCHDLWPVLQFVDHGRGFWR